MKMDFLVAEIGSTTTVVNGFHCAGPEGPVLEGQGQAPTTPEGPEGVIVGLKNAIKDLAGKLEVEEIGYGQMLATSSAAGGLRMTVHGLVYDMTVRAAREAALGAGANILLCTAGRLTEWDLAELEQIKPNLILLAGGTDYGEQENALLNARLLCGQKQRPPVIYAGNIQCRKQVGKILTDAGFRCYFTENVYPKLDELNIEPARKVIHQVFEEHIVRAPGMARVREMVGGVILPTPGAVMECARLLYEEIGDLLVLDVGGATTDVHSVTEGSEEIGAMLISPEPIAKRTVEGDLGIYVNACNLVALAGEEEFRRATGINGEGIWKDYKPIPENEEQRKLARYLTWLAASTALTRHSGKLRYTYGPAGRQTYAEGKDLTKVKWLIGTGGALTRLPGREKILEELRDINKANRLLLPRPGVMRILIDQEYIMASLGALSVEHPGIALALLKKSLGLP